MKHRPKNSMKKLTFTTLCPTYFESFYRKFEVIAILFPKLYTNSEKIVHFLRKGCHLPTCLPHTVKTSHCPFYCQYLAEKLNVNAHFLQVLVWPDWQSNPNLLYQQQTLYLSTNDIFMTVLLYTEYYVSQIIILNV